MNFSSHKKWTALFGLWALHGAAAVTQFLAQPAEDRYAPARILTGGILLAWLLFAAFLFILAWRNPGRLFNLLQSAQRPNSKDALFVFSIFAVIARIWIALASGLFKAGGVDKYAFYAGQFAPLLDLVFFVALEVAALIAFFAYKNQADKNAARDFMRRAGMTLLLLALASLGIYFTGLGLTPEHKGDWARGIPAVALLEWQVVLACIFCAGMVVFESKYAAVKKLDAWIFVAVWAAAAALWLSQPIIPSSSALKPHEPNFEIYPFNDAQVYDQFAQSALIGEGYGADAIPQRPLYIVLLTLMRAVAGQNYGDVIFLQTLWLAFFPALLYLFGREFFGRPVGIAVALLAILRDYASGIAAPFTGNLSYSKLFLSEIPTAMTMILFLLLGIRWIKSGFPLFSGFVLGGILGIGMLIRTQVVVAFPVLILFAFLTQPKHIQPALKSAALGLIALALTVTPWLARNWYKTGKPIFDSPASQTINLALRYSRLNGNDDVYVALLPGETEAEYNDRMIAIAKTEILSNPLGAAKGVASFFANHCINNILLLPLRYDLSPGELWQPVKAFWQEWRGGLNLSQTLLLGFYVFLFGLGLAVAWQRLGWLGFLPLGVNLAYNLWTSIALLSGQRFMVTMDWSVYAYYVIGLFGLISACWFVLERGRGLISAWYAKNQFAFVEVAHPFHWRNYLIAGVFFFAVGASLWATELIFPRRYSPQAQAEAFAQVVSAPAFSASTLDAACLQKVVAQNGLKILQGRALYPRYYQAGDGEAFTDAAGYKKSKENRVVFEVIGQTGGRVIFPVAGYTDFFPHAADVTLGMDDERQPWFILIVLGNQSRFYLSTFFDASACR